MQIRSGKFATQQPEDNQYETGVSPPQIQSPKSLAQLSQQQRQQISEVFILFDKDKDGLLTTAQLATVLRALGFNPSNHQIVKLSQKIDPTKSGYFGEDNLLELVIDIGGNAQSLNDIIEALKVFEKQGSPGKVELEVLKEALLSMGQRMNEAEFAELLSDGDIIFGSLIDIEDFARALYNRGGA